MRIVYQATLPASHRSRAAVTWPSNRSSGGSSVQPSTVNDSSSSIALAIGSESIAIGAPVAGSYATFTLSPSIARRTRANRPGTPTGVPSAGLVASTRTPSMRTPSGCTTIRRGWLQQKQIGLYLNA